MSFVVKYGQVDVVCRCGRLVATVGMDRSETRVTADRYGFVTVRARRNGASQPGDVTGEGGRLHVCCGNPRCRYRRTVRHDTLVAAADRAYRLGRRVELGTDL
jgi:hypothetical protein